MNRRQLQKFSRRWHRRLGVVLGIQFLFWTLGGVYFAWFHIENVRGQYEKTKQSTGSLNSLAGMVDLPTLQAQVQLELVNKVIIKPWLDTTVVLFQQNRDQIEMYDAFTGRKLSPISESMAVKIAQADFYPQASIQQVTRVTLKSGEYKGPVPAYRIDFDNTKATHIYVHENTGEVTARRNRIWRMFDFLWMLHILDFGERENFNNWLLKILSILGLVSILSGYILWASTTPLLRKKQNKKMQNE